MAAARKQCSMLKPDGSKCPRKAIYGPTHAEPKLCLEHASEFVPGSTTMETLASSFGYKPCSKICSYPGCTTTGSFFDPTVRGARVFRCDIHKDPQRMISNTQWRRRTYSDPGSRSRIPHRAAPTAHDHRAAAMTLATMSQRPTQLADVAQVLMMLSPRKRTS